MARPKREFPPYPKAPHKKSGQARVRWEGKDYYLGPFGSEESRERYAELIQTIQKIQKSKTESVNTERLTVSDVCDLWRADGIRDYRPTSREPKMIGGYLLA